MNYETVSQAMLGSNRCLSGKDAGEFVTCDPIAVGSVGGEGTHDILKKCTGYQDPMLYMNESLLPNDLDRLRWRTYAQKNPIEATSVFYTMDENNFLHTAREAILSAYTKIFEFSPETSKILLNSAPSSIEYYGGYRNYALNIYGDDAYGFNIVGKTLELLRAVLLKKKNVPGGKKMMMTAVQKGFQQFETPEMIGLLLLTITVCWNRLITGVDDLRVFFGKSVFEIVMMLGLQYSSNVLFSLYHRYDSGLLLRELPHLDKTVLQNLVEQELMYPGNLVGFLRKHGFHHYYLAVRQNVYRTLWMSVGRRLMKNRYNHIPEDKWSLFLSENTRPELLEEKGPSLVQAFLRGKIEVEDVQMTQKIEFLHQPNLHQDALYFVPRVYSLHSTNASLKLFDYIDYEDALDRLSPSYVWKNNDKKKGGGYNLVMEHGLEFPTVLHYIYFKTTAVYFPQDTASLQSLYKRIMFSSSPDTFVEVLNDTMKQRFEETVHQRRRELLREGIVKRIESNPVLMMPVTYFGIENNIHLDNDKLFTKLLPDDHAVVLTLCDERENIFPELDTVFTRFHQAEHSSIHMTTQETQLVFRVWTALYTKLLTWVQFVDSVIKKPVEAGWIELFFRVFQPETEKFRTVAQMVEVLSGIDPHAVDLKHHSDYISESMVAYFISHTTNPIAKIMKKLSKTWGAYISYNIRALVALREWTEVAKRGTPDIEKYLPHIPKLFLCSGVDSDEDSGGDKSVNNDVVGGNGEEEKRIRDVMKKMSGILKPVWEWAKERKVWDDHFMLYLAWDLSKKHKGEVRYTGLQPLHSYISLPERVKVQKKMITTDPITGDVKTENVPVFEVRNVKTKVPLGFSSSISRALFDTYFSFLDGGEDSDHSAMEKKSIEKTKIQLSYILRDILRDVLRDVL